MNELLAKHEESCAVAEHLIETYAGYNVAVHCAYYSCLQLVKHVLFFQEPPVIGVDRVDLVRRTKGPGSHIAITRALKKALIESGATPIEAIDFTDELEKLKKRRTDAAYNEWQPTKEECRDIKTRSETLNGLLKSKFVTP